LNIEQVYIIAAALVVKTGRDHAPALLIDVVDINETVKHVRDCVLQLTAAIDRLSELALGKSIQIDIQQVILIHIRNL
jgi:hypothetical protein